LANTLAAIEKGFWWENLMSDVTDFVSKCPHCLCTRGGIVVPRPLGGQLHGTKPNDVLHWDYLRMGTGEEYIFVIKGR
jgi:hypothetical protein